MTRSLVIAATLLVASRAAAVPRNTVQAHIDKAMKAHKEGKFDVALDELKAAYTLDPKPDLLFAIAQVYVKLDNCPEAITYYEKFLATTTDPQARDVVTQAIDACKAKAGPTEPKVEPKIEPVVEPKVEPPTEPKVDPVVAHKDDVPFAAGRAETPTRSPWYKDPIGDALVIGGVASAVGALVMYTTMNDQLDKAEAANNETDYLGHRDSAETKRTFAVVFGGASAVLITAGIVRYKLRGGKQQETRLSVTPTTEGGLVTLGGRF